MIKKTEERAKDTFGSVVILAIFICMLCSPLILANCRSSHQSENVSSSAASEGDMHESALSQNSSSSGNASLYASGDRLGYEDPDWPTRNAELLAVPESQRWQNAWKHVGTRCTVTGPVVSTYCASSSAGKPLFVNIGEDYPSKSCVSLVIWTDGDWSAFSQMVTEVDLESDSWLSVSGYLQSYNGHLQFNADDGVEYTWWTNAG